jgi:uncharacterized protein (TIGR04255 family)
MHCIDPFWRILLAAWESLKMPFVPVSGQHAIQEVVFIVHFDQPLAGDVLDRIFGLRDELANDLPNADRPPFFPFAIGPNGHGSALMPAAPVSIQSFKRDGSLDWRLHAAADFVAVNCLSYSRWELVYVQAKKYLSSALSALIDVDINIKSIVLQYIDSFKFEGELKNYSVFELIDRDSGYIPPAFSPSSHFWHVHIGQYENLDTCIGGSLLNRVHLDSVQTGDIVEAKIDSTHQYFLDEGVPRRPSDFEGLQEELFNKLHLKNKSTLKEILTDEVQKTIGLAESE